MTRISGHAVWMASAVAALAAVMPGAAALRPTSDPFAFFGAAVAVTAADRERLDRGEAIVHVLPARDGELGVFAATRLDAPADALVTWTRDIPALKKSPYVLAIHRFSNPPVLEDLKDLVLDEGDVEAIRRCRIEDFDVQLGAQEIDMLREAAPADSAAIQQAFHRVILRRVQTYEAGGMAGLAPYVDRPDPVWPRDVFLAILAHSPYLPPVDSGETESFFYWSKEQYGAGKRVIAVTHVEIVRPDAPGAPSVIVLGQEIFASHYRNGSLGVTAVVGDFPKGAGYLVYINRSHVDVLGGVFGGLRRLLIEGRVKSESAEIVRTARRRLESGWSGS